MIRRAVLVVFLATVLSPAYAQEWAEVQKRFREGYTQKAPAEQRLALLREVASVDQPKAAELLLSVWTGLTGRLERLQKRLGDLRAEITKLEKRPLDSRPPGKLEKLYGAEAQDDAALARAEAEKRAIVEGIRSFKSYESLTWLAEQGMGRVRSPLLLREIATHVATAASDNVTVLLRALEKAKRPEQVVPLLQALHKAGKPAGDAVERVTIFLPSGDPAVRIAAARALTAFERHEAVKPLIDALRRKRVNKRAQREVTAALQILTRQPIGPYADLWAQWWQSNGYKVERGEYPMGGGKAVVKAAERDLFYGLPQADRIIYVVDISGSMEVSMRNPRWIGKKSVPASIDEDSRWDAAKRQLLRAVKALHPSRMYTVILYSSRAEAVWEELVPASKANYEELEARMEDIAPVGSTNIYMAMQTAFKLAGVYPVPTKLNADAIYLVSDGSPTTSKGEVEDPERTLHAVAEWNALQRVQIHTIGIGRQHNAGFMRSLSGENGGIYKSVTPQEKKRKPGKKKAARGAG